MRKWCCLALFFFACTSPEPEKIKARRMMQMNGISLTEELVIDMEKRTRKLYQDFHVIHENFDDDLLTLDTLKNGIYFPRLPEQKAKDLFSDFSDRVKSEGGYLFLTNLAFDANMNTLYDVAIIEADNMYDVIRFMNTTAVNYGLDNDAIVKKLRDWDMKVQFNLVVADEDRIEALMQTLPEDLEGFAKDVHTFCPDVIDQGYGSMEEMLKDYRKNKYLWLWWD